MRFSFNVSAIKYPAIFNPTLFSAETPPLRTLSFPYVDVPDALCGYFRDKDGLARTHSSQPVAIFDKGSPSSESLAIRLRRYRELSFPLDRLLDGIEAKLSFHVYAMSSPHLGTIQKTTLSAIAVNARDIRDNFDKIYEELFPSK